MTNEQKDTLRAACRMAVKHERPVRLKTFGVICEEALDEIDTRGCTLTEETFGDLVVNPPSTQNA